MFVGRSDRTMVLAAIVTMWVALSGCGMGNDATATKANPCDLLTLDEIQAATGQMPAAGARAENVCTWATEDGGMFSLGITPGGDAVFDSAMRTEGASGVAGIADRALHMRGGQVTFMQALRGPTNLRLDYSGPKPPDDGTMTDLLKKALARL